MKQKIFNVISILYGLLFINSGLNKFLNYMPMPEDLPEVMKSMTTSMFEIGWLFPLVGVVEIIGGLLLFIPKYRALGAIMIFPIMVGIILTHIYGGGLPLALVFGAILGWIIYENWEKYTPMIK